MGVSHAQVWIQDWKEHSGKKGPLWIEEIWRSFQGLPSREYGCNGLLDTLRRPIIMVAASSEAGWLRVL